MKFVRIIIFIAFQIMRTLKRKINKGIIRNSQYSRVTFILKLKKNDFEIKTNAKKSRRFDLSEVIFK